MAARGLEILARMMNDDDDYDDYDDYDGDDDDYDGDDDDDDGGILRRKKTFHEARRVLQKILWGPIIRPGSRLSQKF